MKSEVKSVKSVSRGRLVGKRTLPTSGSRQAILPVKSETENETDLETLLDRGAEWRKFVQYCTACGEARSAQGPIWCPACGSYIIEKLCS